MRDSAIFYRSFYEALKDLPPENQAELYTAIFEYSLNFKEVELTGLSNTIFKLIKPQLEANNQKYKNGKKGGKPANGNKNATKYEPKRNLNETKDEPKRNLNETKDEPNVNVNVNVNSNGNEKENNTPPTAKQKSFKSLTEDEFKYSLVPFVQQFGKKTVRDFFDYWTEPTPSGKMRFQLEKAWDTKRRLTTWKRNEKDFGNTPDKEKPKIIPAGPWNV